MKRFSVIMAFIIAFGFSFLSPAKADERNECIIKGEEAVTLIKDLGSEAAFKKMQDYDEGFRRRNGYIMVIEDENATMLSHPYSGPIGQEHLYSIDDDGKFYCQEIIRIAKTKGKGWISCNYMGMKQDCYVLKVPDENMIVVSICFKVARPR